MARRLFPAPIIMWSLVLVSGCDQQDAHIPPDGPPPVAGGTLETTPDGRYAIASDPARAALHIVDLEARHEIHRLDLEERDEPGRVLTHSNGRAYVVLRQAGEVLSVDPARGEILERRPVCAAPRGIDEVPDSGELVVACASGDLVYMPAIGVGAHRTVKLEPDLRDVVAQSGGVVYVSRFRAAEVLVVERDAITSRIRPGDSDLGASTGIMTPTVAWRMREVGGELLLLHQQSRSTQLGTLGGSSGVYYGGDCNVGVMRTVATMINPTTGSARGIALSSLSLGVDATLAPGGDITVAAAAEPGPPDTRFLDQNGYRRYPRSGISQAPGCVGAMSSGAAFSTYDDRAESGDDGAFDRRGPAIAVANFPGGILAQYRDPPLILVREESGATAEIPLSGGSVEHIGHALFHEAAGTGATCAGCHPEGGEDGHVWLFESGTRRSQTLRGGILETAPFHWTGDVAGVTNVFEGTFVGRMGGEMPRPDEVEAFGTWVDALPQLPGVVDDPRAVDHGETVFNDAGCGSCHAGARMTDNQVHDVGTGGMFQVPSLTGALHHAPYFHDGSAATLEDLLERHATAVPSADRLDLARYLRSL